jgi:hypothetical protein
MLNRHPNRYSGRNSVAIPIPWGFVGNFWLNEIRRDKYWIETSIPYNPKIGACKDERIYPDG